MNVKKIIAKLDSYFIRMTNSDSARSKFAEMSQTVNQLPNIILD